MNSENLILGSEKIKLSKNQQKALFNAAIKKNDGISLFICNAKLTKEQNKIAFENAIENNQGFGLLRYSAILLTQEQKQIALNNAIKIGRDVSKFQ